MSILVILLPFECLVSSDTILLIYIIRRGRCEKVHCAAPSAAAAFLLLCSTAFAGQTVTLDKYGVSFTVPDGFTWVKTEDAELLSDDVKKLLENDQAIGGMVNKNHDHLSLTIVEDEYINAINYDALSDEKLLHCLTNR